METLRVWDLARLSVDRGASDLDAEISRGGRGRRVSSGDSLRFAGLIRSFHLFDCDGGYLS